MSTTPRELARRLRNLLLLGFAFCLALIPSYYAVHEDAVRLADSTAPAVLDVETATQALRRAKEDTEHEDAGSTDFTTQISVASQSLTLAASENVTGSSGRQTLQTAIGLTNVYTGWVRRVDFTSGDDALNEAYLGYADDTLDDPDSTGSDIMGRLADLQRQQHRVVAEQSEFGWRLRLGWAAVLVLGIALLGALVDTHRFLRSRFRRRWNRPLLAAGLLLAGGTGGLGWITLATVRHLADARRALDSVPGSCPRGQVTATCPTDQALTAAGRLVSDRLGDAGTHAGLLTVIIAGAALLLALLVAGLLPRMREYPAPRLPSLRPAPRALVISGLCLALVAGGLTVGIGALRSRGSVTLLANWTGTEQRKFQREVLAPFEKQHRIDVVYQGSSAQSQVLAADTVTNNAPDVVVLPGVGELRGYAAGGQLIPLDDVIDTHHFPALWAPPTAGPQGVEHIYWVPVKADVKSLVWWHTSELSKSELPAAASDPGAWCLGMGAEATSGWPGSDWVEDILLQQAGRDYYESWATGKVAWTDAPVRDAFETWGRIVGAGKSAADEALKTAYGDAAAGDTCSLLHAGSSVRALGGQGTRSYTHSASLIPGALQEDPWEVSGDLAAVLKNTPQARELVRYLASPPVQRRWAVADSGFSVSDRVPPGSAGSDPTARDIAHTLRDGTATHCWDASDAMPPALRDAFTQTVLQYLARPERLSAQLDTLDKVRKDTREDPSWQTAVCDH